jgi:hypothetical protein
MQLYSLFCRAVCAFALVSSYLSVPVQAQETSPPRPRGMVEIESGGVWVSRNDARIPGDTGTRFNLRPLLGNGASAFFRLNASYDLDRKRSVRFVYAPLQVEGTGTLAQSLRFADADYAAGLPTEATYKFNSYRATYRWRVKDTEQSNWNLGFTLKVRDARIALRQGEIASGKSDLGLVPLLHFYGEQRLCDRWSFIVDFDGLVAPQGRAFDLALKAGYDVNRDWRLSVGYRTLEGGADNDRVYNFAWLNYGVLSIARRF